MSKETELIDLFEQLDDSQFNMVLNFTKTLVQSQAGQPEHIAPARETVSKPQQKRKRRSTQAGAGRRKRQR